MDDLITNMVSQFHVSTGSAVAPKALQRSTNVALLKAALQSSISKWSIGKTCESDARIATNGNIVSNQFFHTNVENAPWWQVDLGDEFLLEEVRIFNRRDQAERLKYFTVLTSLSGDVNSWLPIYRKCTNVVFGQDNDTPFVITLGTGLIARFVRIQLDQSDFLHFRQCEVMGYRPVAEHYERLRREVVELRQRMEREQERRKHELAVGRRGTIVRIGAHDVFVDEDNYSSTMINALNNGEYEGRERAIIKATVQPADRVLEIGTAVGAVTMTLALIVGPENVMTFDANPVMVADARRNFIANSLDEISANVGVIRNRGHWVEAERDIDFFVARDFWASRLDASLETAGITSVIKVPLVCLESLVSKHGINVLVCDIEGGEAELLTGADLSGIQLIIIETHYWACGRHKIDVMIRFLLQNGFNINLDHTGVHVVVLDRGH